MSALDLLKLLEQQGLLSPRKLNGLRRQVEGSPRSITAAALCKALVKRGVLSSDQAERLLQQLNEVAPAEVDEDDELGLAPDDDFPAAKPVARPKPPVSPAIEPLAPEDLDVADSDTPGLLEADLDAPVADLDAPAAELDAPASELEGDEQRVAGKPRALEPAGYPGG